MAGQGVGPRIAQVLFTAGDTVDIAEPETTADGGILIDPAPFAGKLVTIIGNDGSALRLTGDEARALDNLAVVDVPATEFVAGISGQGWDSVAEAPVTTGMALLRHNGDLLSTQSLSAEGSFVFEMTTSLPLIPGHYELLLESPRFVTSTVSVEIAGSTTVWRLGRIHLLPRTVD